MKKIIYCLLVLLLFIPAVAFAEKVDEKAFSKSLALWKTRCTEYIDTFKALSFGEADTQFISLSPLDALYDDEAVINLEEIIQPMLLRWNESWDEDKLTPDDRKIIAALEQDGLVIRSAEGSAFIMVDGKFLNDLVKPYLSPKMQVFVGLLNNQPPYFISDAACLYSVEEMGVWAVEWEQYLVNKPIDITKEEAKNKYEFFMEYIFFSDMDNTPAFPQYNSGRMEAEWREGLEAVVAKYPDTKTAIMIRQYLEVLKSNNYRLTQAVKKNYLAQIEAMGN